MKYLPLLLIPALALADGPKDNLADDVRPVPPLGVEVPAADADALKQGLKELRSAIDAAAKAQAKNPKLADLLPDVEIFYKSVDWALKYQEVHKLTELKTAQEALAEGKLRAGQLKEGKTPWTTQKGLVVRAYRSKIDGSIQPYGLVIPESYSGAATRLDVWCHGRSEMLSELAFVDQRRKQSGLATPANAIVLHLYGRYCCANKFAGEIDLLEALAHSKKFYNLDEDRMVIRGFSMGGAAVWQFAVNYSDKWCAASPGAGFAETPEFLKVFQTEDVSAIPEYEKTLWHWYNATDSALNLFNTPTIAYSGEIDKQKQAADIMEKYLKAENIEMIHIIGPQTAHKMHPDSLIEIERRLADITAVGRDRTPEEIHFTTWFLRYNKMHWISVDGLGESWKKARVHAKITGEKEVTLKTENVTALTLDMPAGHCPFSVLDVPVVKIDGKELSVAKPKSDRSWQVHLRQVKGAWTQVASAQEEGQLAKHHGLSGPIDDAFMDSFMNVTPTGKAMNDKVGAWSKAEMERAAFEWRRQFRGDALSKADKDISDADIAANNLVLWGDPQSNAVMAKVIAKLPIEWTKDKLVANGKTYDVNTHAPVLVYPNPLNPKRYVVINSSFTYREYDYLNNARQVAKLPDWAIVDLTQPKTTRAPGGIADAGFFGEAWEWKKAK
ncbi:prolyl oligopeptidase family protein [Prosthecobacter fusiformis]|uniref:Prolyl oligopeptidase family protein n=1 Tax=Prosthecobacter fusiformis TaxID=48464 RepID=A0A4R7RM95_9BACT|nr:prolyl oligopeptidase family serine peptidase [Prosthecobacter fusiformis]TDU66484.1 prolyl oligopeptidase family protein [Prosthecobacter fusiformis]